MSCEDRGNLLFRINCKNDFLKNLSKLYWQEKLKRLIDYIEEELFSKTIVLFGSLIKLEVTSESDIDLVIISKHKKKIDVSKFEKNGGEKFKCFMMGILVAYPMN